MNRRDLHKQLKLVGGIFQVETKVIQEGGNRQFSCGSRDRGDYEERTSGGIKVRTLSLIEGQK